MSGTTRLEDEGSRFKRYPAYRDSGVEWLGDVPEGWEVKRLSHLVDVRGGGYAADRCSRILGRAHPLGIPQRHEEQCDRKHGGQPH